MIKYVLVRVSQAVVSLVVLTFIVFGANFLTGDPTNAMLSETTTFETRAAFRHEMGFDRPFVEQYADYLSGLVHGDLGNSTLNGRPVSSLISQRMPATVQLGLASVFLTLLLGIPMGLLSAYRRGTWTDGGVRLLSVLGQSAPTFWVGTLLVLLFSVELGWFPSGGRTSPLSLVLPTITLSWMTVAGVTRLLRSSSLEILESDYVRFARIKGLSERQIMRGHVLRNAALPVLTFGGVMAANALTGSVVTEQIFVWPGIGRLLIDSINARDYPVVQGVVLVFAVIFVCFAFLVDLLYVLLNPRLRRQRSS